MGLWFRAFIVTLTVGLGIWFVYPTVYWYFFLSDSDKKEASLNKEALFNYVNDKADKVVENFISLANTSSEMSLDEEKTLIREILKSNNKDKGAKEDTLVSLLSAYQSKKEFKQSVMKYYTQKILKTKRLKKNIIQLGLDLSGGISATLGIQFHESSEGSDISELDKKEMMIEIVDVLSNRLNVFGVADTRISVDQQSKKLFIDLPGEPDVERINFLLKGTGNLNFFLINNDLTQKYHQLSTEQDKIDFKNTLGKETRLAFLYEYDEYGITRNKEAYVLNTQEDNSINGSSISRVQLSKDNLTGQPIVNFSLNEKATQQFHTITKNNLRKPMAIVFNNEIKAIPNINSVISAGNVSVSGFSAQEAQDLSRVLRTGSVPLTLTLENSQIIGPSLAQSTVRVAFYSLFLGLIAVFLFCILYYRTTGIIINLALILNLFFSLAILSVANFTLTLTSVSGLILSIGMAVDANVIIFETLKDFYKNNKYFNVINQSFDNSFLTVMDANVTTLIAALLIAFFGSGPLKGFAFTLSWGLLISMYSAFFVSHWMLDVHQFFIRKPIRISWFIKH